MVRSEIFGFDPLLIFVITMIGIIILAFIVLSNKDPLLVLIIAALLAVATMIIGNLFEYGVYSFSYEFQLAVIQLAVSGQHIWFILYLLLNQQLQPITTFITDFKYFVIIVIFVLFLLNCRNALRGGWKTLHTDQFKEKEQ